MALQSKSGMLPGGLCSEGFGLFGWRWRRIRWDEIEGSVGLMGNQQQGQRFCLLLFLTLGRVWLKLGPAVWYAFWLCVGSVAGKCWCWHSSTAFLCAFCPLSDLLPPPPRPQARLPWRQNLVWTFVVMGRWQSQDPARHVLFLGWLVGTVVCLGTGNLQFR